MADTLIREAIAYSSQPLSPVPQYWDGSSYGKVYGTNGAIRAILYDSAGETFTDASPGSVTIVSSAGGSAVFNSTTPGVVQVALSAGGSAAFSNAVPGTIQVVTSAGATNLFSGTNPGSVQLTATSTVNFSGTETVEIVTSAGGTAYFSNTNPAFIRSVAAAGGVTLFTATITWTAGTTATSSQTISITATTASVTTNAQELLITNDGPYALVSDLFKTVSANSSSFNVLVTNLGVPGQVDSAGVTYGGARSNIVIYNFNQGAILRLTVTAAFTAAVTNNIFIKELQ